MNKYLRNIVLSQLILQV